MPRLEPPRNANHGIPSSVIASDDESDCLSNEVDTPILYGTGNRAGFESHYLLDEEIVPVCSHDYLEKLGHIDTPEGLLKGQLLYVKGGPVTWVSWYEWFDNHQMNIPHDHRGIEFNSLPWTIQAPVPAGRSHWDGNTLWMIFWQVARWS